MYRLMWQRITVVLTGWEDPAGCSPASCSCWSSLRLCSTILLCAGEAGHRQSSIITTPKRRRAFVSQGPSRILGSQACTGFRAIVKSWFWYQEGEMGETGEKPESHHSPLHVCTDVHSCLCGCYYYYYCYFKSEDRCNSQESSALSYQDGSQLSLGPSSLAWPLCWYG